MKELQQKELPQFPSLELLAKHVVEGFIVGLHKSPFHGFSVEFSEHRLYNQGESTRHIDWKIYGKTDKLFVKRFEEETNLRCQIVIDTSNSMFFPVYKNVDINNPNKAVFSIYAAATLMHMLQKQRDAVGLTFFNTDIQLHTQAKSAQIHHKSLITELSKLLINPNFKQKQESNIVDALHFVAENIHKRSMVIIFSDMFNFGSTDDRIFDALQHLKYNKHEVILFHVVDKNKEIDFDFDNKPYKFIDMETGEEVKIKPHEVKAEYVKALNDFASQLKLRCSQYDIDFVEADINKSLEQVLMPFLVRRNKLK
ncbi:MAG: DUF58 domain-containing protein [Bacteroidales bacterium]|jgi:uncharacterized protein (DUF58 family)